METYNNIRQLYPSFRLSTILKSIETTLGQTVPEPAEDIYKKINGNIFLLSSQDGRCTLSTIADIQSPYLIKSYDNQIDIGYLNQKVKYIIYDLHPDVYEALKYIYMRENNTNFPFFNSYATEYWNYNDLLQDEEYNVDVHNRILELKPTFNLDNLYKKIQLIYNHAQTPVTFQIPEGIKKVSFSGKEILFETVEGNKIFPCNLTTYDIVVSKLNLQCTRTIPFVEELRQYSSTYSINV